MCEVCNTQKTFDSTQYLLLFPPFLSLVGLASYLIRSVLVSGQWVIEKAAEAAQYNMGAHEDFVLVFALASVFSFLPWLAFQGYLAKTRRVNRQFFWVGLLLYLGVGYLILGNGADLIPWYWD